MAKSFSILPNARVMPLQGTIDAFVSGVFHNGVCLPESLIEGRSSPAALVEPVQKLSGTYIFGGYLFGHFGHCIVESLAYLHIIRQCGDFPILFMSPRTGNFALNKRILRFLNVFNEIILIKEPTQVEKLVIGPAGSQIKPPLFSDAQIAALGTFPASREEPSGEKIWLSRSEFRYGGLENEAAIEKTLQEWGWKIMHPECLPLPEQVRRISTASCVAGLDGSAFYGALLADTVHGRFFVFSRRNHMPPILELALSKKTGTLRTFTPAVTHVSGVWPDIVYRLDDPEQILGVLRGI
ncbi:hypothetical protein KL86DPRO_10972 [uncultured delta proteobacterium]|uniref:Glycosyltransferase 61 catalytic domain-containing protein n=1 Tax=uncultured delta proteobacterium TaxID=34034 RepID=A0A212J9E0_9DELT|nr:hypothetical protein KL86DPRO_10972 [uncultured delta proteobacterium]